MCQLQGLSVDKLQKGSRGRRPRAFGLGAIKRPANTPGLGATEDIFPSLSSLPGPAQGRLFMRKPCLTP